MLTLAPARSVNVLLSVLSWSLASKVGEVPDTAPMSTRKRARRNFCMSTLPELKLAVCAAACVGLLGIDRPWVSCSVYIGRSPDRGTDRTDGTYATDRCRWLVQHDKRRNLGSRILQRDRLI